MKHEKRKEKYEMYARKYRFKGREEICEQQVVEKTAKEVSNCMCLCTLCVYKV